jgi:uncharacterized protein
VRGWIAKHPLVAFVALAFGWSYLVGLPAQWAIGAWLSSAQPLMVLYLSRLPVVAGPAIAAVVVIAVTRGRGGVREWRNHERGVGRPAWWWIPITIVFALVGAVAFALAGATTTAIGGAFLDGWALFLGHLVLQFLIVGLGEELGWRGWLLPRLLERRSPVIATLVVAAIWGGWHLPILFSGIGVALSFAAGITALSFLHTAVWRWSRKSAVAAAWAHASVNAPIFFLEGALGGTFATRAWLLSLLLYAPVALIVVAATWSQWKGMVRPLDLSASRASSS